MRNYSKTQSPSNSEYRFGTDAINDMNAFDRNPLLEIESDSDGKKSKSNKMNSLESCCGVKTSILDRDLI